jgi:hypothetical protein
MAATLTEFAEWQASYLATLDDLVSYDPVAEWTAFRRMELLRDVHDGVIGFDAEGHYTGTEDVLTLAGVITDRLVRVRDSRAELTTDGFVVLREHTLDRLWLLGAGR